MRASAAGSASSEAEEESDTGWVPLAPRSVKSARSVHSFRVSRRDAQVLALPDDDEGDARDYTRGGGAGLSPSPPSHASLSLALSLSHPHTQTELSRLCLSHTLAPHRHSGGGGGGDDDEGAAYGAYGAAYEAGGSQPVSLHIEPEKEASIKRWLVSAAGAAAGVWGAGGGTGVA